MSSPELRMVAWSVLLGLLQVFIAAGMGARQRGLAWNAGNRDQTPAPLEGAAARADRASRNFLETFVFFAAAALALVAAQRTSAHTAFGAQLYFWARVLYFPVYVVGIPYLRTAVFAVSVWGLLQLLEPLL